MNNALQKTFMMIGICFAAEDTERYGELLKRTKDTFNVDALSAAVEASISELEKKSDAEVVDRMVELMLEAYPEAIRQS